LRVRILSYASGIDTLVTIAGQRPTPWLYDGRLRMVGVKLYLDGALGSRGAWLKQDYRDAPGQRGLPLVSDTVLKNLMSRAAMDNFQVAVHAIGDAAIAELLAAIEDMSDTYNGDRRWRIEHAQIVDPADLPRFARNGIIASMQPVHQTSDMRMAEARMGLERLQGAYAWRSMADNRVPLAFGSDFPVESPNPFHGLAAAISREDATGNPPGGWLPQQRLTMEQAFAAFTRGGAYAGFAEDRLGTLEPGRMADFLFIDRDIFEITDQRQIRETQVLETWIAGRKAWNGADRRAASAAEGFTLGRGPTLASLADRLVDLDDRLDVGEIGDVADDFGRVRPAHRGAEGIHRGEAEERDRDERRFAAVGGGGAAQRLGAGQSGLGPQRHDQRQMGALVIVEIEGRTVPARIDDADDRHAFLLQGSVSAGRSAG
jgi:hypothetical protein